MYEKKFHYISLISLKFLTVKNYPHGKFKQNKLLVDQRQRKPINNILSSVAYKQENNFLLNFYRAERKHKHILKS